MRENGVRVRGKPFRPGNREACPLCPLNGRDFVHITGRTFDLFYKNISEMASVRDRGFEPGMAGF